MTRRRPKPSPPPPAKRARPRAVAPQVVVPRAPVTRAAELSGRLCSADTAAEVYAVARDAIAAVRHHEQTWLSLSDFLDPYGVGATRLVPNTR